jgi:RimJ/RimL family protein N-acetyltransferase
MPPILPATSSPLSRSRRNIGAAAYAFDTFGLERLAAVVDEPNARSHRLMLRIGFTPTGITATGPCYPLRTYRLARSAFRAPGS